MKKNILSPAVRQVLRDYREQYQKHPFWSILAFTAPAIGNICIFFIPPLIVSRIINEFSMGKSISLVALTPLLVWFGGLWLLGEILWKIGFLFLIKLEAEGIRALGRTAFERLSGRDYDFYTNNFVGSLSKKASSFARSFEIFTDTLTFNIITHIFPLIFAVIILARFSWWLPLLLVASLALVVLIAVPIIRRRSALVAVRHEASSRMVGRLSDALTNMLAIKSFAKEVREQKVYGEYVDDYVKKFKKAGDFQNINLDTTISPFYVAANTIGLIATLTLAGRGNLAAGDIFIVFSYFSQVTRIFWEINRIYRNIESSISEAAEFTELMLEPPTIADIPGARKLKVTHGRIAFSHLHFNYHPGQDDRVFLDDFNLTIEPNQKVGLVGPSGSGKTTITKLLLRFIGAKNNAITIDGQAINDVTQASLREAIAYVPQEPLLFHRSLYENIAYGDENATEKEVIRAAKLAHAHEFISGLPEGYATLVGERGIKLSGGQRQRVAIARALLKKSSILVLDEATSSLDSESEKYIQDGLEKLMRNKTALVIAHRLSTIKHLDRIIVLEKGRIVQDGSHDELVRQKGMYAKLWSHQTGEFF